MLLLSFGGTLTVTDESLASNLGTLEVTDDSAVIDLEVDARAGIAFAERFQRLGIRAKYDTGSGTMATFPGHIELGDSLIIEEDADRIGDTLTFAVVGEKYAPFARQVLRARTKIEIEFITGSPQNEFSSHVFTGWIVSSTFDVHPPRTTITVLDAAALHAEKRARDWSLPPNSGRTRLDITTELLNIGEIPIGALDFGGGGGIVNKPHTLGDTPIISWLIDFLAVIGVEVGFANGLFVATRYDATLPPVLELNPSNLFPDDLTLSSPDTLAANVLGVVSVSSTRTEVGGIRTLPEDCVTVEGPYAPASVNGPLPSEIRKISEVCTISSFLGSLDVHTEQTTWGWYAVLAAGAQIQPHVDPPGWEVVPTTDTVYVYPDGTTRADPQERYRRTGKIVKDKYVDANLNVIRKTEAKYFFHFLRTSLFHTDSQGVDTLQGTFQINDDGQGVIGGREIMGLNGESFNESGLPQSSLFSRPDSFIETDYTLNDDDAITMEVTKEHFYDIGQPRRHVEGSRGYGVDPTTYTDRIAESYTGAADEWGGLRIITRRYRAIDEDRYEAVESVKVGNLPPTVTSQTFIGALPRPERAEPTQSSQEIRAMYEDRERIAMAGEEIEDVEHNEFIETDVEAVFYAKHRARLKSAIKLAGTMPIEGLAHKWRMVRVNLPGASIDGLSFYIRSVRRDASSFSQAITADYYAPGIV